jgi:carbonic anhydrase
MCFECVSAAINRRSMFKLAVAGAAATLLPAIAFAEGAEFTVTPEEALQRLKDGNAAFVADADACAANLAAKRTELAKGQHPYATIVTCSDSRVSPELIFGGATLGDLFVARNAGNVVDTAVLGTLEYGAGHLLSPLIVVMGHKKCGAIAAACDVVVKGAKLDGAIAKMVEPILPVALQIGAADPDLVLKTVTANAVHGAELILNDSAEITKLVAEGKVRVIAAVYDLETGVVEFLDAA